jgi:hypothetical protein
LPGAIDGSWQSILYSAEILLCGVLPIILLSIKKIRETREGLLTGAILGVMGIMSQRMSLSMFTMYRAEGTTYVPALGETIIAFAIPAAAILVYLFFAENLQLFGKQVQSPGSEALTSAYIKSGVFSSRNGIRGVVARRSGFAVFVIALALPTLSLQSSTPVSPVSSATGWETLHIDGNKSGYVVNFPHLDHQDRFVDENTGKSSCQTCHHLDMPEDEVTACWECHTDFNQSASIFDHNFHQSALGGNDSCLECHTQEQHVKQTAAICQDCHENMVPTEGHAAFNVLATSYQDAMHSRCLDCHEEQALEQDWPELALCSTCHTYHQDEMDQTYASASGK